MICVTVARGRHRMVQAEQQLLADQQIPLTELRVDFITRDVDISRLLRERPTPVLVTCRRPQDGGRWRYSEEQRLTLLRTAIAQGAEYVDLEWDVALNVRRYGKTKRVVSYHNFQETPANLPAIWEKMRALDPDIIKIATMANSPEDNWVTLGITKNADIPTIAFCMGDMGTPSRILCGKFGAPFTFASISSEKQLAPGQISFDTMRTTYHYDDIKPSTKILGVIADPVAHSMSPVIHNACLRKDGLDMVYLPFRVPAEGLDAFIDQAAKFDITGLSVTIPHKERILRCVNDIDNDVSAVKACNTVLLRKNLRAGKNTDISAAMRVLKLGLELDLEQKRALTGLKALVLGGGGVSKAIAWGLQQEGARVFISARNKQQADVIAADLKIESLEWETRQNFNGDILINGTPVGMFPNMNETPFPADALREGMVVFDTIYNPQNTLLIKQAREAGCRVVFGSDMFVEQAAMQYKYFTGREADKEVMAEALRRAINPAKYN
jgi:3-dehydroquinate dehydratase / shikimate dehydrogenase